MTTLTPDQDREHAEAERRKAVALFRYGVIADLIHAERGQRGLYAKMRERAAQDWEIPGTLRRKLGAETIRGWLSDYRRGGFDALLPKVRRDAGCARAIPQAVADLLCEAKEQHPDYSVTLVIDHVKKASPLPEGLVLAPSTVHRVLSLAGLMEKKRGEPTPKDRRRFSFEMAGELWMSDVMHGPSVVVSGRQRKTYLIAIIDDATRMVPYAAFALSETASAFLTVLEQAIRRRGIPKRIYVDNGSAFRAQQLAMVCAKLGITLIHARPYTPQGKGKMERWFRTVRLQLLPTLQPGDKKSLDAINRRLWGWVEGEYHRNPHRGLEGETPADRWASHSEDVRLPPDDLAQLFLFEQKRRVQADRTVSLDGIAYEVDATLVGETVVLRYDPSRPREQRAVQIWHRGKQIQLARRVDVYANCFVKRDHGTKALHASEPAESPQNGLRLSDFAEETGAPRDPSADEQEIFLMYRKHFGLTRHPFSKAIEPEELFASAALRELEARLGHLLDLRGIGVITGESGSGKTTACRKMVAGLHTGLHRVLYVSLTTGNVMDLYKTIAWEIGLPIERNRAALFRQIRTEVSRLCGEAKQKPVLIVDEAHHLRSDVLEDLRLLTNYAMDSENRLCLVLVGHPELRRRLNMAVHEALSQRVVVRAHVPGLSREEVAPYLEHLLRLAGTELPLFEPSAQEALFQASSGLPRKLNLLAHHALLAAALAKAKSVTTEHLQSAMTEIS